MKFAMDKKIKVFIFSDQPLFRDGIRNWLSSHTDIEVLGDTSVTNTTIFLNLELMPPEVAIVDIDGPSKGGLELTHRLRHLIPDVGIIALSSDSSDSDFVEALKLKLAAYLSKSIGGDDLLSIIRRVAYHEDLMSTSLVDRPGVAKEIISKLQEIYDHTAIKMVSSPLGKRETEVVSHVARGCSNKEIALKLGISQQTVKSHLASVMSKLDASDRAEAAVIAVKNGLIS
jgi:two-component system nitrate/nitrite response regulator NarL